MLEFIDLEVCGVMNTSIDIYQMPLFAQFTGKLSNIDAHTPGVFSP
jgi:hypothetical protein